MDSKSLYSIGHGARKTEDFIKLLKQYGIRYVADVRSFPQSRLHPQFNRKALENSLGVEEITYVFLGDQLGGRPADKTCYIDGVIDYERVATKDFYKIGIERLKTAL